MSTTIGLKCKAFRGTAGTTGSTEITNIKDVTLNLTLGDADVTTRAAQGWQLEATTLFTASLSFTILYDPQDEDFTAFRTAFFARTPLSIFVSDGAGTVSTACSGLDADWVLKSFEIQQPLDGAVAVSIECSPTNIGGSTGRNPSWKTATS